MLPRSSSTLYSCGHNLSCVTAEQAHAKHMCENYAMLHCSKFDIQCSLCCMLGVPTCTYARQAVNRVCTYCSPLVPSLPHGSHTHTRTHSHALPAWHMWRQVPKAPSIPCPARSPSAPRFGCIPHTLAAYRAPWLRQATDATSWHEPRLSTTSTQAHTRPLPHPFGHNIRLSPCEYSCSPRPPGANNMRYYD